MSSRDDLLFAWRTPNRMIVPEKIMVEPISNGRLARLQPLMSSADWRPGPGRKISFEIQIEGDLLGILQLASPVFSLGPRDDYLELPKDSAEKGAALRQVADMSVCVGAQPISWHWNIGKLIAMIAPTLSDDWETQYGDPLRGIQTTSVYGRSSQYNKVMTFLGFTKGHGTVHVSDEEFARIRRWLTEHDCEPPADRLARGRMGILQWYEKMSGERGVTFHGRQRGVYWSDALPTSERASQISKWYERWGLPRYERTKDLEPPYDSGVEPTKAYREVAR